MALRLGGGCVIFTQPAASVLCALSCFCDAVPEVLSQRTPLWLEVVMLQLCLSFPMAIFGLLWL